MMNPSSLPPLSLTVELTNICNLHCAYCIRDDEALHHQHAEFFSVQLLSKILNEAQQNFDINQLSFTGGEPTIHPQFAEILSLLAEQQLTCSFVTNGWQFERVYPALIAHRDAVHLAAFSLDGATAEAHDFWRGKGSFARVMCAITRCFMSQLPFAVKVVIRRDTMAEVEQIALLAARLGAANVQFSHLLPTSAADEIKQALTLPERQNIEHEISQLDRILKIPVGLTIGWRDTNPAPPCPPLQGANCNIDYRGRLTLCCNLSGFRGAESTPDIVANLQHEEFSIAYERLRQLVQRQNAARQSALQSFVQKGEAADLYTGSPCLFCLQSFGKIPWQQPASPTRNLPVFPHLSSRVKTQGA